MAQQQTHIELNRSGDKMPLAGFGCWKIDDSDCEDTIYNAIKAGYRLIDGAAVYENEVGVGRGINKAIKEGIVKREDLFGKFLESDEEIKKTACWLDLLF